MRILLFIIVSVFLFSCRDKDKVPRGILPHAEMKDILWDLMRADEFVKNVSATDTSFDKKAESIKLYNQVFHIHNISKEKFDKSLSFYQSRPDLLKVVMDSLKNYERMANEELYRPRPLRDTPSFKKIKPLEQ